MKLKKGIACIIGIIVLLFSDTMLIFVHNAVVIQDDAYKFAVVREEFDKYWSLVQIYIFITIVLAMKLVLTLAFSSKADNNCETSTKRHGENV